MKRIPVLALIPLMSVLFACNESTTNDESVSTSDVQIPSIEQTSETAPDTPGTQSSLEHQIQLNADPITQSNPVVPVKASQGVALNPPHGEPGHDCAIAVGAPLNSAPSGSTPPASSPVIQQTSPVMQQSSPVMATPPAPVPSAPAPVMSMPAPSSGTSTGKVNPPHGEPGHDCAKAVGAPLD